VKQVTQRLRDGTIELVDVPVPELSPDGVLVDVRASVLSAGTERTKVETARKNLLAKARARPDQVRQVREKLAREGWRSTLDAVRARLDQPSPLGYSCAGVVVAAGERVRGLAPGDRVACGGATAAHAELVSVPANLAVRVPDGVDLDQAAFATVGTVAMHGVRQADVRLGERVGVIGLGLIGQIAGQMLRASGCHVVGVDLDDVVCRLATESGAADEAFQREVLNGELPQGAADCDAVIISAATSSADPVTLAAKLCRDRGRVVVLGDVGLDVPRADYYERELDLRLSRSYGPGRYDTDYEERGLDYPIGYVRWTERRNMSAVLDLVASHRLRLEPLIADRVPVDRAADAYDQLTSASSSPLGLVLRYEPTSLETTGVSRFTRGRATAAAALPSVGVIGAGSFAQRILIPAFRDAGFPLAIVASGSGLSAAAAAERFPFARTGTTDDVLNDPGVGLVVIATRHSTHAELTARALRAGKHVFVEKPPFLTSDEADDIARAIRETDRQVGVGFNRRHAPLARALRDHVRAPGQALELLYRVNAGTLTGDHWLNRLDEGGGRLLGEGCHFVDFACWLVGREPDRSIIATLSPGPGEPLGAAQRFSVTLSWADGSLATILYSVSGAPRVAKEYIEAHSGGRSALLDDFRVLRRWSGGREEKSGKGAGDKGHRAQVEHFASRLRGTELEGEPQALATMDVTLRAWKTGHQGAPHRSDRGE
jgi:predicted dehydrogenase